MPLINPFERNKQCVNAKKKKKTIFEAIVVHESGSDHSTKYRLIHTKQYPWQAKTKFIEHFEEEKKQCARTRI